MFVQDVRVDTSLNRDNSIREAEIFFTVCSDFLCTLKLNHQRGYIDYIQAIIHSSNSHIIIHLEPAANVYVYMYLPERVGLIHLCNVFMFIHRFFL